MGFSGSMFGGGGLAGGAAATGGWVFPTSSDLTLNQGSYGMTLGAGQNGFANRITIDIAANSNYFDRSTMGSVFIDTGKTIQNLIDANATACSVMMKLSSTAGDGLFDGGSIFHFGPMIIWGNALSSSKTGGYYAGIGCFNVTSDQTYKQVDDIGRIANNSTLTLNSVFSNFNDGVTNDKLIGMQLTATGMKGNARGNNVAGFTGGDFVTQFETAGGAKFHDVAEKNRVSDSQNASTNTETLHLGICFGQRVTNSGIATTKTLDFDFKYLIETDV